MASHVHTGARVEMECRVSGAGWGVGVGSSLKLSPAAGKWKELGIF